MDSIQAVEVNVKDCSCVEDAVKALVNGIAGLLDTLTHDPVAIKALAVNLRANADKWAAEVCACDTKQAAPGAPKAKAKDEGDQGEEHHQLPHQRHKK